MISFSIVTPYKGSVDLLYECLESVQKQNLGKEISTITHYIVVDDATQEHKEMLKNHFPLVKYHFTDTRKGPGANHWTLMQGVKEKMQPDNIIVHLDGDDFLLHRNALRRVAQEYENPNVWSTYGNYVSRQPSVCLPVERAVVGFRDRIVKGGWCWSHLRTFRSPLIKHLLPFDLEDEEGKPYTSAADVAIMSPVLELCGKDRVRFIDEDLMYYRVYPGNEMGNQDHLRDQIRCALSVYHKPARRQRLEKL